MRIEIPYDPNYLGLKVILTYNTDGHSSYVEVFHSSLNSLRGATGNLIETTPEGSETPPHFYRAIPMEGAQ